MRIERPYPPSANRYWRTDRGGRPHVSDEARSYKRTVGLLLSGRKPFPRGLELAVSAHLYRPAKRGDLDNSLKVLFDSLKGFAFHDDAQIVEIHASRLEDKYNPRAVVWVEPLAEFRSQSPEAAQGAANDHEADSDHG